jgi:hypothetical protein
MHENVSRKTVSSSFPPVKINNTTISCWVPVPHTCDPNYFRGWKLGGLQFEASPGKKFASPHLNQTVGVVAQLCYPKLHKRMISGGLWFQTSLTKNVCGTPISIEKKLDMVACVSPVMMGSLK